MRRKGAKIEEGAAHGGKDNQATRRTSTPEEQPLHACARLIWGPIRNLMFEATGFNYFVSTLWHSGDANASDRSRQSVTVQYCQPYISRPSGLHSECVDGLAA